MQTCWGSRQVGVGCISILVTVDNVHNDTAAGGTCSCVCIMWKVTCWSAYTTHKEVSDLSYSCLSANKSVKKTNEQHHLSAHNHMKAVTQNFAYPKGQEANPGSKETGI